MARLLTQLGVDKARPRGRRYELPDGPGGVPGFALRVGETGVKSYVIRYRVAGQQRRVTLGPASIMSLATARARARVLVDQARQGIDPAADRAVRREQARYTVAAVAGEYVERHLKRNLRSAVWLERRLRRDLVAAWGERPIAAIGKADVVRLVDGIADRGAGVSANRTLQLAHRFFAWCVKRSIIEINPAAGVDLPYRERERERTLSESEIAAVWSAFEQMAYPFGDLGRLLLLLAQRRGETISMRWDQINFERATWTIPSAAAKTGAEHLVPLPAVALRIIEAIPRLDGSPFVFPGRLSGSPISSFSVALKTAHAISGTTAWTWHDCRRTARTGMARLGVLPHIGERVLNHAVAGKIAKIYDVHKYQPEVRRALELWSVELERIVGGGDSKIVPMRTG